MPINTKHFKEKLLEEKNTLEKELSEVARRNPQNPNDWEPVAPKGEVADDNLAADSIEDYEENIAITGSLEARLKDVETALENIEMDKYGICEVCSQEIEEDRLEANPAARTCKSHLNN